MKIKNPVDVIVKTVLGAKNEFKWKVNENEKKNICLIWRTNR